MSRLALLFIALLMMSGCSSAFDNSVVVQPTYGSIANNILSPACLSCHSDYGSYTFDSYASVINAVVPGFPSESPLYVAVSSGRMPKIGPKLSNQQIQAIGDWITAGALDN